MVGSYSTERGNILYVYSTCGIKDEANLNEVTKKGGKKIAIATVNNGGILFEVAFKS